MSDIGIRFDGLLLAGSLIVVCAIYLFLALWAGTTALMTKQARSRRLTICRQALLLGFLNFAALVAAVAYIEYRDPPTAGPDWIDWLALPVLILFAAGCIILARGKSAPSRMN